MQTGDNDMKEISTDDHINISYNELVDCMNNLQEKGVLPICFVAGLTNLCLEMLAALPVMYCGNQSNCDEAVKIVKNFVKDFVEMSENLPESLEEIPPYAAKFDGIFIKK